MPEPQLSPGPSYSIQACLGKQRMSATAKQCSKAAPRLKRAKKTTFTRDPEGRQGASQSNSAEREGSPRSQNTHLQVELTSEVRYLRGRKWDKGIVK